MFLIPLLSLAGALLTDSDTKTRQGTSTDQAPEPPKMYRVVLVNDPSLDGMIIRDTIADCFRKTPAEAMRITLNAHTGGQSTVGVYSKEIAETRIARAAEVSREKMSEKWGLDRPLTLDLIPE
jgi:ATP-dependent Clp protease adaptor protein ClpS